MTDVGEQVAPGDPGGGLGDGEGGQGCIILAGTEASVPVELLAGLSRRGLAVTVVTDAPGVLLHLARHEASAFLVAAGEAWAHRDELLDAIRLYHPRTALWEYARAHDGLRITKIESPRLVAAETNLDAADPTAPAVVHVEEEAGMHSLPAPAEPLVTEAELSMLLGSAAGNGRH